MRPLGFKGLELLLAALGTVTVGLSSGPALLEWFSSRLRLCVGAATIRAVRYRSLNV